MPTLLQINTVVNYGSTGRIAGEIGQFVIQHGWESYIAYGRNGKSCKSKTFKIGTDFDVKMHGLQTRLFDRHGLASRNSTKKLIEQIQKIKPDIIHLHNLHGYYLNIEILFNFLAFANIPIVWTLHDCWSMTGHCVHFDYIGCEKWKTKCFGCPQKTRYPASILIDRSRKNHKLKKELFTLNKKMTIVPVSNWLSSIVQQSFLSNYSIKVINNGIDLEVFASRGRSYEIREKYGINNRFMLLGVATTWSDQKGLKDYIKLSHCLFDDFIIVLVGLTKKQIKSLPAKIIGLNRTEDISELTRLYATANIVLNLSTEESFGLTTVEGFACGTPSIVYNCTASPELMTHETGFIVEKGDIQGLINAINTVKQKEKSSYSEACRQRAECLYDKNDRYMDYFKLCKSILKKYHV